MNLQDVLDLVCCRVSGRQGEIVGTPERQLLDEAFLRRTRDEFQRQMEQALRAAFALQNAGQGKQSGSGGVLGAKQQGCTPQSRLPCRLGGLPVGCAGTVCHTQALELGDYSAAGNACEIACAAVVRCACHWGVAAVAYPFVGSGTVYFAVFHGAERFTNAVRDTAPMQTHALTLGGDAGISRQIRRLLAPRPQLLQASCFSQQLRWLLNGTVAGIINARQADFCGGVCAGIFAFALGQQCYCSCTAFRGSGDFVCLADQRLAEKLKTFLAHIGS